MPHSSLFEIPFATLLNNPKSFLFVALITHFSGPNPAFLASATSLRIIADAASASRENLYLFWNFSAGHNADKINATPKIYKL